MRRLIFLVLACTGAVAYGQGVLTEPQAPTQPPEPSLAMIDHEAPVDPLGTPPPRPATRKQLRELSEPSEPSGPSEPVASLAPPYQDSSETWVIDDQIDEEEVAAYQEARVFLDPGSVEQAQELVKSAEHQLETSEFRDAMQTINSAVVMLEGQLGRYDPMLIEPVTILGRALHGQGDYPDAIDAYERAVLVARINGGLPRISKAGKRR